VALFNQRLDLACTRFAPASRYVTSAGVEWNGMVVTAGRTPDCSFDAYRLRRLTTVRSLSFMVQWSLYAHSKFHVQPQYQGATSILSGPVRAPPPLHAVWDCPCCLYALLLLFLTCTFSLQHAYEIGSRPKAARVNGPWVRDGHSENLMSLQHNFERRMGPCTKVSVCLVKTEIVTAAGKESVSYWWLVGSGSLGLCHD
jgi:hypothetical protein